MFSNEPPSPGGSFIFPTPVNAGCGHHLWLFETRHPLIEMGISSMQRLTLGFCSIVLFLLAGCGGEKLDYGPLGTLKGKVTFKGEPFIQGTVILAGAKSGTGAAFLKPDGTFFVTDRIGGIPVGTYNIAFQPERSKSTITPIRHPAKKR
jgi:hypothetical protein